MLELEEFLYNLFLDIYFSNKKWNNIKRNIINDYKIDDTFYFLIIFILISNLEKIKISSINMDNMNESEIGIMISEEDYKKMNVELEKLKKTCNSLKK
jgi:hypothetical protein